ncbi:hypothetical protein [Dyella psychrodurans]|uniref:CopL family metal-binding regulatory protein n=1 Tax=Dyella psychrodurans TaxID=1927960 RepID=A0A370XCU2_9GAMM|nr:hypothetical protein [Dyella psychrodurans]RDS86254.1 hypothetical protein DWU99_03045 [Dyella psychrodurans]
MSSQPSTHKRYAARSVRVLAWFAWLLMVLPAYATSAGNALDVNHTSPAAGEAFMAGHHVSGQAVAHGHDDDGCCGKSSHGVCHCDEMCGAALLPSVPFAARTSSPAGTHYASLPRSEAPTRDPIPPLRPPSV